MHGRADVRSFEAVERFRAALIGFMESARAALASAEADVSRTLAWLETDQLPHWKGMLRQTAEDLEKARSAYREKRFFKDASGARSSAIDELKALRKIETKRAEVERRDAATRRNLRQLQRDLTAYQGGLQQIKSMLDSRLPMAVEELRAIVEQLERYAHAAPAISQAAAEAADMARQAPIAAVSLAPARPEEQAEAAQIETLRRRTPGRHARATAVRAAFTPALPEIPKQAMEALRAGAPDAQPPGRYGLITTTLRLEGAAAAEVYLERTEPGGGGDTGWHIGPASARPREGPCVTITVGRLTADRPEMVGLLALPVGTLIRTADGRVTQVVDGLGRVLWPSAGVGDVEVTEQEQR